MKDFDKYIRDEISEDDITIPDNVKNRIEKTLINLPDTPPKPRSFGLYRRLSTVMASIIFVLMFLLPNISVSYAHALEDIPVIGDIIKVVTIRNYYSDTTHELDANIPQLDVNTPINDDIKELTDTLIDAFYHDLESYGDQSHYAVNINHEVITNTTNWFTLKLEVNESLGSSNTYYKYYHLNKITGEVVTLGDIINNDEFYPTVEENLKDQMRDAMSKNSELVYWVEDSEIGEDFVNITPDHNFYFDANNNLVIPFDKYEVSPGYMGTSEFTISKDLIIDYLKPEIINTIK